MENTVHARLVAVQREEGRRGEVRLEVRTEQGRDNASWGCCFVDEISSDKISQHFIHNLK